MEELRSRGRPAVVIEEDEAVARRLLAHGERVVHASLAEDELDLRRLAGARALVANGEDDRNALFALGAREQGFRGTIVALIDEPSRRAPMMLAGASAAFTPNHALAAVLAVRASARIGPRVAGVEPLGHLLEVAEIRVHDGSPLAGATLAGSELRARTGTQIVGQWKEDSLHSPPGPARPCSRARSWWPPARRRASAASDDWVRPITEEGPLVVVGSGDVREKLVEILRSAGEPTFVVDPADGEGWTWPATSSTGRSSSAPPSPGPAP